MQSPNTLAAPDGVPDDQHPRQRATQACTMCHSRKIKCDALKVYPCTKCKDAKLKCILRVSNRGRNRRANKIFSPPEAAAPAAGQTTRGEHAGAQNVQRDQAEQTADVAHAPEQSASHRPANPEGTSSRYNALSVVQAAENLSANTPKTATDGNDTAIMHVAENGALAYVLRVSANDGENVFANYHIQVDSQASLPILVRYREALSRLDRTSQNFLASKGVFDLPSARLTSHLIQLYFDYVDPHIPFLNKTDFMKNYKANMASPLLLQSMLFVASHHMDKNLLSDTKWSSRAEFSSSLFEKAKLLADFELEKDQLTLVQSYVLLGHRWGHCTQDRGQRYWLIRALNVGTTMGMLRRRHSINLPPLRERLWRRVSWVLSSRDKYMAAAVGAPPVINDQCTDLHNMPSLQEADFDEGEEQAGLAPSRSPETVKYGVDQVALGLLLGTIIQELYSPKRPSDNTRVLQDIQEQLDYYGRTLLDISQIKKSRTPLVTRAEFILPPLIRGAYVAVSLFYYRALCEKQKYPELESYHRRMLSSTVRELCDIARYLREHDLLPFCPTWVTTCAFHAGAVLLAECRESLLAPTPDTQGSDARPRLCALIDDLRILEQPWGAAGWVRELFETALTRLEEKAGSKNSYHSLPLHPPYNPQAAAAASAASGVAQMQEASASASGSTQLMYDAPWEAFGNLEDMLDWEAVDQVFWNQNQIYPM